MKLKGTSWDHDSYDRNDLMMHNQVLIVNMIFLLHLSNGARVHFPPLQHCPDKVGQLDASKFVIVKSEARKCMYRPASPRPCRPYRRALSPLKVCA